MRNKFYKFNFNLKGSNKILYGCLVLLYVQVTGCSKFSNTLNMKRGFLLDKGGLSKTKEEIKEEPKDEASSSKINLQNNSDEIQKIIKLIQGLEQSITSNPDIKPLIQDLLNLQSKVVSNTEFKLFIEELLTIQDAIIHEVDVKVRACGKSELLKEAKGDALSALQHAIMDETIQCLAIPITVLCNTSTGRDMAFGAGITPKWIVNPENTSYINNPETFRRIENIRQGMLPYKGILEPISALCTKIYAQCIERKAIFLSILYIQTVLINNQGNIGEAIDDLIKKSKHNDISETLSTDQRMVIQAIEAVEVLQVLQSMFILSECTTFNHIIHIGNTNKINEMKKRCQQFIPLAFTCNTQQKQAES